MDVPATPPGLYLRQILAGQMENFVYAIGCEGTRKVLLVDPAWEVDGLLSVLDEDGYELAGVLITHYHPDHCGGDLFGHTIEGVAELLAKRPCPVHVQAVEADGIRQVTGLEPGDLTSHAGGDRIRVGDVDVELVHTPGHTPGSQCFRVKNLLISGDTLFLSGCGRVDLPGGDSEELFHSLRRLTELPDDTVICPGHMYGWAPSATLEEVRRENPYLAIDTIEKWRRAMGPSRAFGEL